MMFIVGVIVGTIVLIFQTVLGSFSEQDFKGGVNEVKKLRDTLNKEFKDDSKDKQ